MTKVVSKQHRVYLSGLMPLLVIFLGHSTAHPASILLLSLGRHLSLLKKEEEMLRISHVSFSFFEGGKGDRDRSGALPSKRAEDRRKLSATPLAASPPPPPCPGAPAQKRRAQLCLGFWGAGSAEAARAWGGPLSPPSPYLTPSQRTQ